MCLQPGIEVAHAHKGVNYRQNNQHDGHHSEGCEGPPNCDVVLLVAVLVDTDQLKEEICQGTKVQQDDEADADLVLSLRKESRADQDGDGDGHGRYVQAQLKVLEVVDDDDELDGEAEEEEEIEFEEGDVNL